MNNYNTKRTNNIYSVCSRDVAKIMGYQHAQVIKHIEKAQMLVEDDLLPTLFEESTFTNHTSISFKRYWITGKGLRLLKDTFPKYERTKPIALELYELEFGGRELKQRVKATYVAPVVVTPVAPSIEADLKNKDGQIVVSSRDVAERFGKRHADVIRAIEEKMQINAKLRSSIYFIENTYVDNMNRRKKEYLLTRDGFTFIVMGFTGKEADHFKLAYIEAFNKMEEALKNQTPTLPTTYKDALVALVAEVEAKEKLQLENKQQQEVIEVMQPKADFCEEVLEAEGALLVSVIAKDYGMSAKKMNELLYQLGVQYKRGDTWVLYREHENEGYVTTETRIINSKWGARTVVNTKWTQKGRKFIHELLKEEGIFPVTGR